MAMMKESSDVTHVKKYENSMVYIYSPLLVGWGGGVTHHMTG